jgi:cytochrome P450 family 110
MLPPGPRTPRVWQTYRFLAHPDRYMRGLSARYGDAIFFDTLVGKGVGVTEANLAREVFAAQPETFEPVPITGVVFGPTAVIAVGGEKHRKLRKMLNPRFHGAQVRGFLTAMQRAIRSELEALARAREAGSVVKMTDIAQSLTLEVILETVFGSGSLDRPRARKVLGDLVHAVTPAIFGGSLFHKSWYGPWRRYTKARAVFDAWVDELVAERRSKDLGTDVLGVLLEARYEDGSGLGAEEIRDQLLTLLLAGHETSAIALAWSVHHLWRTPAVLAKLRAELAALGPSPAPEAIVKCRYLGAVVSETLRIEPIVTDVARVIAKPFDLGGRWRLEPGHLIAVMLVSILHDPRTFEEPLAFRPERFIERSFSGSEFLPFGGGARRCLGAAFAEAELAMAIAEIVRSSEIELVNGDRERSVRRNVTMGPSHGVPVRVKAVSL